MEASCTGDRYWDYSLSIAIIASQVVTAPTVCSAARESCATSMGRQRHHRGGCRSCRPPTPPLFDLLATPPRPDVCTDMLLSSERCSRNKAPHTHLDHPVYPGGSYNRERSTATRKGRSCQSADHLPVPVHESSTREAGPASVTGARNERRSWQKQTGSSLVPPLELRSCAGRDSSTAASRQTKLR